MKNLVLVIVPFIDNVDITIQCIESLLNAMHSGDSLLLIDNGSKPGNFNNIDTYVYSSKKKYMEVIHNRTEHYTLPGVWNFGLDLFEASGDNRICFIHNDCVADTHLLTELRLAFDAEPDCGIAFPRQSRLDKVYNVYDVIYPQGYCFMLSLETLRKVGRFNPDFKIRPDTEYFKRAKNLGVKLVVAGRANVTHVGGRTTTKMYSLSKYMEMASKEVNLIFKK